MTRELFIQVAYALGIGLLIGVERSMGIDDATLDAEAPPKDEPAEKASGEDGEASGKDGEASTANKVAAAPAVLRKVPDELPGMRTFSAISLFGFAAALVGDHVGLVPAIALAGLSVLVVAMYLRATSLGTGITTEAAALAVCVLGMLCHYDRNAAGVLALVLAVMLASKRFTHETVAKMRRVELTDTLKFLVVILIVLPLLPNRALDPYGSFNPYKVGFLVVLISGIGFVGYFLTRFFGAKKGLGLTGVLGGLTSSTAVTAAMAAEAKRAPHLRAICAFSTVAANATMFIRVLVVVALLDRALMMQLAWPVGAMGLVAAICAIVLWVVASRAERAERAGGAAKSENQADVKLKNPFSVGPALKFGAFFVGILFVAKLAKIYLGNKGLYAAGAVSGLADVDAITLSIAEQTVGGTLPRAIGAIGITIAIVSNSVVKTGIAIYSGGWGFGRLIAICLGLATAVGLVVAFTVG